MATTGIAHYVTPSMTIFDLPTAVSVAIKIESESRSQTIHAEGWYVRLEFNLDLRRQIAVGSYGLPVAFSTYGNDYG